MIWIQKLCDFYNFYNFFGLVDDGDLSWVMTARPLPMDGHHHQLPVFTLSLPQEYHPLVMLEARKVGPTIQAPNPMGRCLRYLALTDRVEVPDTVQQWGTWGSLFCINTIYTIGKRWRDRNQHCYYYKKILPLGFVDDLNRIVKCGQESLDLNTFLNAQIEQKILRLHVPDKNGKTKCHKLHIGKPNKGCPSLKVHGTSMPEALVEVNLNQNIGFEKSKK